MRSLNLLIMLSHFICLTGLAQPDYNRNALTLVALDFQEKHSNELYVRFGELQVPDKFFNNSIQKKVLPLAGQTRPVNDALPDLLRYIPDDFIQNELKRNKVAQSILSTWFNRQSDGSLM